MTWRYYDRKVHILFVTSSCFVRDSCCFHYDKSLIMSLSEVPTERETDEVDLDSDGYRGPRISPRLYDPRIKANKPKRKRIYIADKVEKNQLSSDDDIAVGQNSLQTEYTSNSSEKVTDLNGIKQCGSTKEAHANIKCIGGQKNLTEKLVKVDTNQGQTENISPVIVIPSKVYESTAQQADDRINEDDERAVPKVSKQRVRRKAKVSLTMKVKMKKMPIQELATMKHAEETIGGGIFRLHVCNKQEGRLMEKLNKKKKCKIHKIPLNDEDVPEEWFERKVWNTLCHYPHLGSHAREEYYRRIIKWRRGYLADVGRGECVLCDIQQLASKPLYKDIDTVQYSHDFYDQFSRQSRSTPLSSRDNTADYAEELSLKHRTPPPAPPTSSLGSTTSAPIKRVYSNIVSPCKMNRFSTDGWRSASHKCSPDSEYTESQALNLQELYVPRCKVLHEQCSPRLPPVQWAPQRKSSYIDHVHRQTAFKAYAPKKKDMVPNKHAKKRVSPIQKFAVKEIGVTYFLPDSNQNLAKRHVSIPKSYTYVPSPHSKRESISIWIPPTGNHKARNITYISM